LWPCSDRLSIQRDKGHILFGGTRILQHTADKDAHIRTPDGGCLAVVLRTGFDTSQGADMRHDVSQEQMKQNCKQGAAFPQESLMSLSHARARS